MTNTIGFKERLLDAMRTNGLRTASDLAAAIDVTLEKAEALLGMDDPCQIDAVTLFRICDRTQFSGRWLLRGELPTTIRIAVTPDESMLLDDFRSLSAAGRDRVLSTAARFRPRRYVR